MVNSFVIGLTGQTGAGKSTICVNLAAEGCAIIDCDVLAHRVLNQNEDCKRELAQNFGQDILDETGKINRTLLGSRAFRGLEQKELLNAITHPYILQAIREEVQKLKQEGKQFIVLDAPTLLECGAGDLCDFIIFVTASLKTRKQRIMQRDHLSEEAADRRLAVQQPDAFYTAHADYVINGEMEASAMDRKVRTILKSIQGGYDG